jgi:hypothetical protein
MKKILSTTLLLLFIAAMISSCKSRERCPSMGLEFEKNTEIPA